MLELLIQDVDLKPIKALIKLPRVWLMVALVLILMLMPLGFQAVMLSSNGNTIVVNTVEDEENNDGDCSLREAIRAANTDRPIDACRPGNGTDQIVLPEGRYKVSIQYPFDIRSDLSLSGVSSGITIIEVEAPPAIDIANAFRITQGELSVSGLSINRWGKLGGSD